MKKDDDEGKDFYYLGNLEVDKNSLVETFIEDKKNKMKEKVVKMKMYLDKPVEENLYKYFTD